MLTKLSLGVVLLIGASAVEEYGKGFKSRDKTKPAKTHKIDQALIDAAPDALDWSAKGALTPVKNQGKCNSCWAFSTIETVESAVFLANGKLMELSTEELITCDKVSDGGCMQGNTFSAVEYLEKNGVATEADYPAGRSMNTTAECTWDRKVSNVKVSDYAYVVPECYDGDCSDQVDEDTLAAALATYGPLSICIDATNWLDYKGGVLGEDKCTAMFSDIDHCVQLVGYDKKAAVPYWKIRNSWGDDWGEEGFIRIPFKKGNACCVGCEAIAVTASLSSDVVN